MRTFFALARAGFLRWSTYRQATVAGTVTLTVFGFLKSYAYLAAIGTSPHAAGYTSAQLLTLVWTGQAIGWTVGLSWFNELANRIRSGEVASDLLRPLDPLWAYLGPEIGRAGYSMLTFFLVPMILSAVVFDLYLPRNGFSYVLIFLSIGLAVVICFAGRYLTNLAAFWLLDIRGLNAAWGVCVVVFSGLAVPIAFFPDRAQILIWATPFPAILQAPMDIVVERGGVSRQLQLLSVQAGWVVVMLGLCSVVQRRAIRNLVVQGG